MSMLHHLKTLADPAYKAFQSRLLPGVNDLLGVRLPMLRGMAGEITRGDWRAWLTETEACGRAGDLCFEERMLLGMVIGRACMPTEERFLRIEAFLPRIDNWSVCDSFVAGLKDARTARAAYFAFLTPFLEDEREYAVRFALVMLLWYFMDEAYIRESLACLERVKHEGHYARMAQAWAVATAYAAAPEMTQEWLQTARIDVDTLRLARRKIRELRGKQA